jgi:hypothetical protein
MFVLTRSKLIKSYKHLGFHGTLIAQNVRSKPSRAKPRTVYRPRCPFSPGTEPGNAAWIVQKITGFLWFLRFSLLFLNAIILWDIDTYMIIQYYTFDCIWLFKHSWGTRWHLEAAATSCCPWSGSCRPGKRGSRRWRPRALPGATFGPSAARAGWISEVGGLQRYATDMLWIELRC